MSTPPGAEIYVESALYMPYRASLQKVIDLLCDQTPQNGSLVDLMCGPGYLLGEIAAKRSDLRLKGVDIDLTYVAHASAKHPLVRFEQGDILRWEPGSQFDVVACTGALHHVPYEQQEAAIERMASAVKPDGFVLISDCYIAEYADETQRQLFAAKLGYEYLAQTIRNGAPPDVIKELIGILSNDVMKVEFKTSLRKRLPILEKFFSDVETVQTWPTTGEEYGDHISICKVVQKR